MSQKKAVKRLVWAGLVAGVGALSSLATTRIAGLIWRRIYHEDPPD